MSPRASLSMTRTTISQADLAKRTREVVESVQHGVVAFVESSGQEQVVLLDALDFRLLQALAQCAIGKAEPMHEADEPEVGILRDYLAGEISLGKAAELLGLSWFELKERFLRLRVPLRLGPASLEEARAEVATALKLD
jgi:hypothetical protein